MKTALRLSTVVGSLLLASSVQAQPAPANPPKPEAPKPAEPKPAPAPAPAPGTEAAPPAPAEAAPPGEAAEEPEEEAEPEPALPPAPAPPTGAAGVGSLPVFPEPAADATQLKKQGEVRPGTSPEQRADVYAEDWWTHARPVLELHGYFRARGELFHKFSLGRVDRAQDAIWPRPADDSYLAQFGRQQEAVNNALCTPSEADKGDGNDAADADELCKNQTQAGANMRFRLNPELHISDNLRVMSQIDLLDNVVFGSTPGGYSVTPSESGGYAVADRDGYTPLGFFDDTAAPPSAQRNGIKDSIVVKRVWAEYATPVGEVRFGRMPNHWGLGMYLNSGDGYDDNYSSTVDRAQIVTGIKPLELYFSAAMDFPNEGAISDSVSLPNPQPYDLAQLDDVDQYTFSLARKKNPQLERLALTRGDIVLNGGLMLIYRSQQLADDRSGQTTGICDPAGAASIGCAPGDLKFTRRGAHAWIPDLWLQLKYKRFRFEAEAITIQGSVENLARDADNNLSGDPGYDIAQWGLTTEIEQKLAEDRLRLGFNFGWASGDADVDSLTPGPQLGDRDITAFAFHPSYSVDLILYRNILTRVQSSYYFKPSIDYDFSRDPNGQRIGGGLSVIWSRASEFMQAPGHASDLGIELDARLYYQSKDGALNDVPDQMGGFFAMLEYGALFPMSGLGYPDAEAAYFNSVRAGAADTSVAQTLRLYLGVFF
jgi:uncharacterized protein (TIGR04551 family)